jgi:hypothetical protein
MRRRVAATRHGLLHRPAAQSDGAMAARRWPPKPPANMVCTVLRAVPLRCCRVDLIIRRAFITPATERTLGITAYFTACGADRRGERYVALRLRWRHLPMRFLPSSTLQ